MLGLTLLVSAAQSKPTCLAATFEGGGSHGAYEASALKTVVQNLPADAFMYDVISGISTGSLNSGGYGMFPMGQEVAMANYMYDFWASLVKDSMVYVPRKMGVIPALFFAPSLYDNSPLVNLIKTRYSTPQLRKVVVITTDVNTGILHSIRNQNLTTEDFVDGVLCSASPPLYFPPRQYMGSWFADGGCVSNLDAYDAINWCRELVDDDSQITLDIYFDYPTPTLLMETELNAHNIFKIITNIQAYDSKMWYLYSTCLSHPDINFRYLFKPSQPLPGGHVPLDFTSEAIQFEFDLAATDTIYVLKNKPDVCSSIANIVNQEAILHAEDH